MIGQTVSHYRILKKIGQGGMGEVYLAEDTSLDRKVALKFLPPRLQDDEIAHRRFVREAKSAAGLDHPYICHIHEVSQTSEGQDFIVMEYVEGLTLQDKLSEGPLPLKEALRIATEVAEALEEAHERGIVHRDIKPSNIMLTSKGHAKVMDFGLAKKVVQEDGTEQDISSALTREGATLGTLAYMSPEQIKGDPVDHRSDIFSFGIVLYEMLTGVHPFRKAKGAETTAAILQAEPPPVRRYLDEVPDLLGHIVRKILAKEPDERYQSAHEVRTDLREPLTEVITSGAGVVVPIRKKPSWFPRVLGLAGLVLAVFIVYLGWMAVRQPSPPVEQERKSIAVLPLDNLSSEPDSDYFSDGLTEDIIAQLSKIGDLKVISRTSVMLYKDTDKNLRQIGQELDVATILEGSVRRADDTIRVVAQLIDAESDEHLWAETYDRQLDDIFAIQSDVAEQIAAALRVELSLEEKSRIEKTATENADAYNLYLLGRHHRFLETTEHLKKAVDYYQQAIRKDPEFAEAYAWLADAHAILTWFDQTGDWTLDEAQRLAEKALELDGSVATAYVTLGILRNRLGDLAGAETALKKALEIDPHHVDAHREYALHLFRNRGIFDEALAELQQALQLDPLALLLNWSLAEFYLSSGNLEKSMEASRKMLELAPASIRGFVKTGYVYLALGEYDQAEQWARRALEIRTDVRADWLLALSSLCRGRMDQAVEFITLRLSPNARSQIAIAGVTLLWAGNEAKAREYLENALRISVVRTYNWPTVERHPIVLGYLKWKRGERSEAEQILDEVLRHLAPERIDIGSEQPTSGRLYDIALIHAIRNDKEEAYRWLEKAMNAGWNYFDIALREPIWAEHREDPRFQELIDAMKARVDSMRQQIRVMEAEWDSQ